MTTAFDLGARASAITAWARMIRPSGIPMKATASAAATAVGSAVGSASPMSSDGQDHQPAGDESRILPGGDHPGQIVQRGLYIGAADRLDEGTDHVVVLITVAVVADGRLVHGLLQDVGGDDHGSAAASAPVRTVTAAPAAASSR